MKKTTTKLIMFITFLFVLFTMQCQQETPGNISKSNANRSVTEVKEKFSENHILVVLKETDLYKEFSLEDFPEVQERCSKVEELTQGMTALLRKQAEGKWKELQYHVDHAMLMDKDTYKRILCFTLSEKNREMVFDTIRILEKRENILHAEPDYAIEFATLPSPLPAYWLSYQYDVFDRVSLPQAWDIETGSSSIMLGVIDSGISSESHIDLQGQVSSALSRDFSDDNYPNGIPGGLTDAYGPNGHGTFIAGILAGKGNGIIGVCWNITLVSLKLGFAPNNNDYIFTSRAISAVDYSASVGIPILNMSFIIYNDNAVNGTYGFAGSYDCWVLSWVIRNYPGLVVCAAGNGKGYGGLDLTGDPGFPACFTNDNLITVGATNQYNDYSASYSNYSDLYIDLFAPGTFYSTTMYGGYDTLSGTSFAAPMVAGTAALIKSKYPAMRAPEIKQLIIKNVDEKLIELGNKCISKGRLNAFKALSGEHLLFGGGTGDPSTPYQIWDEHHLSNIGVVSSKHFILMDDITLPYMDQPYGMPTWKPIPEFSGYLDGNGKTVSNLCVWEASTNSDGIGLFATNTGTIANLHIIGKVGAVGENTSVGMVSGYNYGIIENITVTNDYGTNVVINNYSSSYSGGITGFNYNPGIIQNCIVNGDVYSTGVRGSFAGFNFYGTISSNTHNGQLLP